MPELHTKPTDSSNIKKHKPQPPLFLTSLTGLIFLGQTAFGNPALAQKISTNGGGNVDSVPHLITDKSTAENQREKINNISISLEELLSQKLQTPQKVEPKFDQLPVPEQFWRAWKIIKAVNSETKITINPNTREIKLWPYSQGDNEHSPYTLDISNNFKVIWPILSQFLQKGVFPEGLKGIIEFNYGTFPVDKQAVLEPRALENITESIISIFRTEETQAGEKVLNFSGSGIVIDGVILTNQHVVEALEIKNNQIKNPVIMSGKNKEMIQIDSSLVVQSGSDLVFIGSPEDVKKLAQKLQALPEETISNQQAVILTNRTSPVGKDIVFSFDPYISGQFNPTAQFSALLTPFLRKDVIDLRYHPNDTTKEDVNQQQVFVDSGILGGNSGSITLIRGKNGGLSLALIATGDVGRDAGPRIDQFIDFGRQEGVISKDTGKRIDTNQIAGIVPLTPQLAAQTLENLEAIEQGNYWSNRPTETSKAPSEIQQRLNMKSNWQKFENSVKKYLNEQDGDYVENSLIHGLELLETLEKMGYNTSLMQKTKMAILVKMELKNKEFVQLLDNMNLNIKIENYDTMLFEQTYSGYLSNRRERLNFINNLSRLDLITDKEKTELLKVIKNNDEQILSNGTEVLKRLRQDGLGQNGLGEIQEMLKELERENLLTTPNH